MRRLVTLVALAALLPVAAQAQSLIVWDYSIGYVGGSLTTHANLADAQAGANPLVSNAFPQRDLAFYLGLNTPYYDATNPTFAYSLTNWFAVDAASSPSNTNVGFYQIYDVDGNTVTAMSAFWDASLTQYSFSAFGGPTVQGCATAAQDCGRLWNGETSANGGSFIEWGVQFSATFGSAATFNAASGLYEAAIRPSSVTGQLSGIFLDGTTSQYYRFEADLNQVSWAFDQQDETGWLYGADQVVPEPATMTLLATGLAGLAAARRRRKVS